MYNYKREDMQFTVQQRMNLLLY